MSSNSRRTTPEGASRPKRSKRRDNFNPTSDEEIEGFHYNLVNGDRVYEVTGIVAERVRRGTRQFLCSFRNFCASQNTWIDIEELEETAKEILKDWEQNKLKRTLKLLSSTTAKKRGRPKKRAPEQSTNDWIPKKCGRRVMGFSSSESKSSSDEKEESTEERSVERTSNKRRVLSSSSEESTTGELSDEKDSPKHAAEHSRPKKLRRRVVVYSSSEYDSSSNDEEDYSEQRTVQETPKKRMVLSSSSEDSSPEIVSSDEATNVPTSSGFKTRRTSKKRFAERNSTHLLSSDSKLSRPPSVGAESPSRESFVSPANSAANGPDALDTSWSWLNISSDSSDNESDVPNDSETPVYIESDSYGSNHSTASIVPEDSQNQTRETATEHDPESLPSCSHSELPSVSAASPISNPFLAAFAVGNVIEGKHYITWKGQRYYRIADILDDRKIQDDEQEYFVRFQNLGPQDDKWLPENDVKAGEKLKEYWERKEKRRNMREKFAVSTSFNLGSESEIKSQINERSQRGETFLGALLLVEGKYRLVRNYISGFSRHRQPKELVEEMVLKNGVRVVAVHFTEAEDEFLFEIHTVDSLIPSIPNREERERLGIFVEEDKE